MIDREHQSTQPPTLKALRESLDLSQEALSRRLGKSWRIIGDWEAGRKIPRFDNAIALARELNVSLEELAVAMRLDISGESTSSNDEKNL
jgi:transcriptional regulator with XRE-family HTH domain